MSSINCDYMFHSHCCQILLIHIYFHFVILSHDVLIMCLPSIIYTASTVQLHEAVVVYPISVLDIQVIHPFLTHSTLKFGIHSQVTF